LKQQTFFHDLANHNVHDGGELYVFWESMVVLACLTVTNQNLFRGSSHRVPSNKCRNSRDWWHRWWVQWEQPGNTWKEAERWGQLSAKRQTDPVYIRSDHFHGPSNSSSSFPPVSPEIFTHHNSLIFPFNV